MTSSSSRRRGLAAASLLSACCVLAAVVGSAPAQDLAEKQEELNANIDQQFELAQGIEAQNAQINDLIGEVSALRAREAEIEEELAAKQAELDEAAAELRDERRELELLQSRLKRALAVLRELLIDIYKSNEADVVAVVLESSSWSEVIAETEYLNQMQDHDERVISRVQTLRDEARKIVEQMKAARDRIEKARDEIAIREREAADARAEVQARWSQLVAARKARERTLESLQIEEKALEEDLHISLPGPGDRAKLLNGQAVAPPNAPPAVKAVIAAANSIADTPYLWGGGHGDWESSGYDCSGAISYALHGGGLIDSPLDSTGFMVYGDPGQGNWISVFAHSGHAFAVIAGLRWDTSGGAGPRWHEDMRSAAGYVARHPAGY